MSIDRVTWQRTVDKDFSRSFPCPRCSKGQVERGDYPIVIVEPNYSDRLRALEAWEPDWTDKSFTTMLQCNIAICGEIVAVSGRVSVDFFDEYGADGELLGLVYQEILRPISMFPAPPLFPIPNKLSERAKEELRLAFQLFWASLSASTSRLRTSLERVLDDEGVATSAPDKKGMLKRHTLFERIDLYEKAKNDTSLAESLTAMRVVGNVGTHGDEVAIGDYFDLLEVYEDALLEISEDKTARLKAKKKALISLNK